MQQDSDPLQNLPEESPDPPQFPFPGVGQSMEYDDALQLPFPTRTQGDDEEIELPFAQQLPSTESVDLSDIAFQGTLSMQVPGMIELPLTTQAIPMVTSSQEESEPLRLAPSNQEAKRAIINGVISFIVSIFALLTVAGFAGLVIGTFAIIYGFRGLHLAKRLPNRAGRGQALVGIILGLIAWCIVLAAIILRAPQSS